LALVAQLAKLHGGGVALTSEVGVGSRFTIVLPWSVGEQQYELELMRSQTLGAVHTRQQFEEPLVVVETAVPNNVLLVEDDLASAALISAYMERCGFQVMRAGSGEEALAHVNENPPDVIIMDVRLRGMDGLETIQTLRGMVAFQHTPILALTALAMPGDRERCLAAGATAYLSKPVKLQRLVEVLLALLKDSAVA
jgi:CheY-like chemotaxis protein